MDIKLEKAQVSDFEFLLHLRKETMSDYLEDVGLPTDDKSHLARIKFYFEFTDIICLEHKLIGMFKHFFDNDEWHIIQIQILPDYQRQGIGKRLLKNVIEKANRERVCVSLSVLKSNPAKKLYTSLGFEVICENSVEYKMQYRINN